VSSLRKPWKNNTVQTAVVLVLIVSVVLGFWFGSQLVLNTKIPPALAVVSGSMCIPYGGGCYDFWVSVNHPFARTLHRGDIIIIQGVDPKTLNANYPNSDIIVFTSPMNPPELIVHRIIGKTEVNGTLYFSTKGDGNGNKWPETPKYSLDPWDYNNPPGVPQNLIMGKVIMRIPWIGWIAIFMQNATKNSSLVLPIIGLMIIFLVIIEFVLPLLKKRKARIQEKQPTFLAEEKSS
jgi:signal peptidase I